MPCLEGNRRVRAGTNFNLINSLTCSPLLIYLDLAVAEALLLWPVQNCAGPCPKLVTEPFRAACFYGTRAFMC